MNPCFIGLDGGGTKTAGALLAADGTVLATAQGGPSAIVGAPSPRACRVLRTLVARLRRAAGVPRTATAWCGIGLSGIDFADEFDMQHAALARTLGLPRQRVVVVNDGVAALWGATPTPAAVILQHGTAFTAACRARHGAEQPFDHLDVGRCFDLRNAALAAVARMLDGRATPTSLRDRILAALDLAGQPQAYPEFVYRRRCSSTQWNRIAPAVFDAWAAGDPAAAALVRLAVADYARAVAAMAAAARATAPDVVFGGGVLHHAPHRFLARLTRAVRRACPGATVKRPDLPPAVGAALMAAFAAGRDPRRCFARACATLTPQPEATP